MTSNVNFLLDLDLRFQFIHTWADLLSGGLSKWRGCRCGCPPCPSTPSVAPDHIHYHLLLLPYPLHNHHHNHHSHFFVPFINAPEFSNTHSGWARITCKNHLGGQKSPWSARITCVSRGHLLSGSRSSSCLQFSSCSSSTLLVTFTVVKVEVVVMLERTTSTSITTITILQLLLLHTLGYLATGRDAN